MSVFRSVIITQCRSSGHKEIKQVIINQLYWSAWQLNAWHVVLYSWSWDWISFKISLFIEGLARGLIYGASSMSPAFPKETSLGTLARTYIPIKKWHATRAQCHMGKRLLCHSNLYYFKAFSKKSSHWEIQPADIQGWPTGNGKKLSSTQAQLGQATCLAVA